jgi:hypothetical protein
MTTAGAGARPKKRNPVVTLIIVFGAIAVANVLGGIVAGMVGVAILANLFTLIGYIVFGVVMMGMATELKNFSNADLAPWMVWIPLLNLWFLVLKVPAEMTKAKQQAGVQAPTRSAVLYFFLSPFALAADLNDIAG